MHRSINSLKQASRTLFDMTKPHSNNWKGGRYTDPRGYVTVYCPEHPFSDRHGYIYEHRLVMEKKIGRYLTSTEIVHHINKIKGDNLQENLYLCFNLAEHKALHRLPESNLRKIDEPNETIFCDCGCGNSLLKYDDHGIPRKFLYTHQIAKRRLYAHMKES